MKNLFLLFKIACSIVILFMVVNSCVSENTDNTKPTIKIYEPTANDTLAVTNDSVHLEIEITDNVEIKNVLVNVKDVNGIDVYKDSQNINLPTFEYHEHYVPTAINDLKSLVLTVIATDKSLNTSSQTVHFFIKP